METLVNLVGVSLSIRPVIFVYFINGGFFVRIFQIKLIEDIQRKVFVETMLRIIFAINRVDFNDLIKINVREKINRAFELKFLQKIFL